MKKYLLTGLLFFSITAAFSQNRFGLKLSPTISFNRVDSESALASYSSNGVGMRFILGPTFDYFLGENYYISTGLLYAPKRVGVTGVQNLPTASALSRQVDEIYNLQFIQIPGTIKMYTNELALDTRLYFQLGGVLEIKIQDKVKESQIPLITKFRPYDISTLLGTGIEYRIGVNTVLYGGISYVRGLLNTASRQTTSDQVFSERFTIKNDIIALDIGIMF
ncbi:MAG: PorT family protein [Bacteroidota bacterium]|nr:PorT family protein [Bacteroidota bacterium]